MPKVIEWRREGANLVLNLPGMPVGVIGGSEDYVYRRDYPVQLPNGGEPFYVRSMWTFIGLDRGDVAEVDIELLDHKDSWFYMRSFHRHDGLSSFESWDRMDVRRELGDTIRVKLLCRVVACNLAHNKLSARAHYGVVLEGV